MGAGLGDFAGKDVGENDNFLSAGEHARQINLTRGAQRDEHHNAQASISR